MGSVRIRKILSIIGRYVLPLVVFALLMLISLGARHFFSITLDTTLLVIALMIATAWFMGMGPGLLMALSLELVILFLSPSPKSVFITINRMALFISVVWFASSRRKAERNLRDQRELLQVTLSSIGDAVIATDENGKINFLNPIAERLTGWKMSEAMNKPLEEVFRIANEQTGETVESPFSIIKREGNIVALANHTVLIAKNSKEIPIEDSGAPIRDADGNIIGVIIVFHDETERRRAEKERERLLESERIARGEAEGANRLKDDFLATVSHELRTPLNAILGWASMLRRGMLKEESRQNALEIIERNAKSQAEIINDILDVSRIITGRLKVDSQPVEFAPIILSAIDTLRPAIDAKALSINLSLEPNTKLIIGDADRLQQIIWNLISNAIKFTPENGQIEIRTRQVNSHLEISVSDNGIGINPDFLPYVFERFRQADPSPTRVGSGLGLGLAIVRHLVELHGGTVRVESAGEGRGSTFTVSLPLANKNEDQLPPAEEISAKPTVVENGDDVSSNASDLRGRRLLVVDDEPDSLEILCITLRYSGAEVREASSAATAMDIFREWKPDVLVSDLAMPVEDGFALIAKIRELPPEKGGNTPAAALTAYARDEDRQRAIAAGFQVHISKPVEPAKLIGAISELLGS